MISGRHKLAISLGAILCLVVVTSGWMRSHGEERPEIIPVLPDPARPLPVYDRSKDRSCFVGSRVCLDCHRSEYVSWLATEHFSNPTNRFEIEKDSIARRYLMKYGSLDRCYQCHTLPKEQRFGRKFVESGVSCESCHGAAGGEDGWLNRHAVYGPNTTTLEDETRQHYLDRVNYCDEAGMIRPGRPYLIAKNCMGCHIIGDPELISEEIGHPISFDKFELLPYLKGEIRHNFHLNQHKNALAPTLDTLRRRLSPVERDRNYIILEQLAKMEVALEYLASLPSEEAFEERYADDLISLFEDGADFLDEYVEVLLEPDEDDVPALEEETVECLLRVVEEFENFDDLDEPTRADARASALAVRQAAQEYTRLLGNGSQLKALDVFFEDFGDPAGKALEP